MSETRTPAEIVREIARGASLMRHWTAYKATDDYANTRRRALHDAQVDGSLWATFEQGVQAQAVGQVHADTLRAQLEGSRALEREARNEIATLRAVVAKATGSWLLFGFEQAVAERNALTADLSRVQGERERLTAQRDELFFALVAIAVNPQDEQAIRRAREVAGRNGHFPDASLTPDPQEPTT